MASTSTNLGQLLPIFYDRVFLERAMLMIKYDVGADRKTMPMNGGQVVYFNRFSPLTVSTTALTDAAVPTAVDMTSTIVSATIATYGTYTRVGMLFQLTSIDVNLKEHVEVMGQNAAETLDTLIAAELSANATVQYAGAKSALTAVAATDTMSGAEIRKAVRTLKTNKARLFEDGLFKGIIPVNAVYDLRANSEWLDAFRYADPLNIQKGEVGILHGVKFYETNNVITESSTTTVYHTYIFGQHAYGIINLEGQPGRRIYVKMPTEGSTDNPVDTFSTVGWKAYFVAKMLNSNWVIAVKSGATA
jgi:N4-gp56 family major capsid protein